MQRWVRLQVLRLQLWEWLQLRRRLQLRWLRRRLLLQLWRLQLWWLQLWRLQVWRLQVWWLQHRWLHRRQRLRLAAAGDCEGCGWLRLATAAAALLLQPWRRKKKRMCGLRLGDEGVVVAVRGGLVGARPKCKIGRSRWTSSECARRKH